MTDLGAQLSNIRFARTHCMQSDATYIFLACENLYGDEQAS